MKISELRKLVRQVISEAGTSIGVAGHSGRRGEDIDDFASGPFKPEKTLTEPLRAQVDSSKKKRSLIPVPPEQKWVDIDTNITSDDLPKYAGKEFTNSTNKMKFIDLAYDFKIVEPSNEAQRFINSTDKMKPLKEGIEEASTTGGVTAPEGGAGQRAKADADFEKSQKDLHKAIDSQDDAKRTHKDTIKVYDKHQATEPDETVTTTTTTNKWHADEETSNLYKPTNITWDRAPKGMTTHTNSNNKTALEALRTAIDGSSGGAKAKTLSDFDTLYGRDVQIAKADPKYYTMETAKYYGTFGKAAGLEITNKIDFSDALNAYNRDNTDIKALRTIDLLLNPREDKVAMKDLTTWYKNQFSPGQKFIMWELLNAQQAVPYLLDYSKSKGAQGAGKDITLNIKEKDPATWGPRFIDGDGGLTAYQTWYKENNKVKPGAKIPITFTDVLLWRKSLGKQDKNKEIVDYIKTKNINAVPFEFDNNKGVGSAVNQTPVTTSTTETNPDWTNWSNLSTEYQSTRDTAKTNYDSATALRAEKEQDYRNAAINKDKVYRKTADIKAKMAALGKGRVSKSLKKGRSKSRGKRSSRTGVSLGGVPSLAALSGMKTTKGKVKTRSTKKTKKDKEKDEKK